MLRRRERFLSGVVEGFYGRPWTLEQRLHLFARVSQWGMNSYLYAPKDDDKHRAYWRDLYTLEEADQLSHLIREATANGINFIYAISPGLDITFSSSKEITLLKRKLDQVKALGCSSFALLFDDIDCDMCPADTKVFPSFAHAQATVSNDIFAHLEQPEVFLFCPTEYCGSRAVPRVSKSQYLQHIGDELHPKIDILWTGPKVISKSISVSSIDELSEVLKRPPVIWDNLHANDYDHQQLFLGPYTGRSTTLLPKLNGVLTNPNCEYGANYVAIHSLAQWTKSADALARRSSSNWQEMQLELKGTTGSTTSLNSADRDCEHKPMSDSSDSDVSSKPSPLQGTGADMEYDVLSKELEEWHLYDQKQVLEASLREWIKEFRIERRSLEHYVPAKTSASVTKATDPLSSSMSATPDDSVDASKLAHVPEVLEEAEDEGMPLVVDDPFSLDDLKLLVDFFFLPHQHGDQALHILKEFCWLKGNAPGYELLKMYGKLKHGKGEAESEKLLGTSQDGMRSDGEASEGMEGDMSQLEVDNWCDRAKQFHDRCNAVSQMYSRLTAISNRPLLYELYQYAWDAKENTMLLDSYISWLESGGSEVNADHEPHVTKGGIISKMQSLLPQMDSPDELFSRRKPPKKPSAQVYTIRPYLPEDRDLLYQTCLETGNNGSDATNLFPNFPDILGDRFVGPYTKLSPELSFALEDSEGVCGYVLGALDSKQFYERFREEWLPTVASKYPKGARDGIKHLTVEEELLSELQNPKFFLPDTLQRDYPSHIHIDLMKRAQGQGIGGRMIKTILSALKAKGSHGVHLEMSADNNRALKFYVRMGFTMLEFDDDLEPPDDVLILGRAL